jgi:hypothetical protein
LARRAEPIHVAAPELALKAPAREADHRAGKKKHSGRQPDREEERVLEWSPGVDRLLDDVLPLDTETTEPMKTTQIAVANLPATSR